MRKHFALFLTGFIISISGMSQLNYTLITNGLNDIYESGYTKIALGDIDGDGDIDILSVGDHHSPLIPSEHGIMVFKNNGNGTAWTKTMNGDFGYGGVALGDVNNDGHMDVAYGIHHNYSSTDFGDQVLEVVLGDGTGYNWIPYDDNLGQQGQTWGMFGCDFADVDNDGLLDLGSNSFGCCDGVWLYKNNGDGTWSVGNGALDLNSGCNFLFGDLDGDGLVDFVVNNSQFNNTEGQIWKNVGNWQFILISNGWPIPPLSGYLIQYDLGDVDNDGTKDIAITYNGRPWVFKVNPVNGALIDISNGLPTTNIGALYPALGDMDGDGNKDLVIFTNGTIRIYRGDGKGNWVFTDSFTVPSTNCYDMKLADFDNNGHLDIAYWGKTSGTNRLRVYLNTAVAATLSLQPVSPTGNESFCSSSVQFIEWISTVPQGDTALVTIDLSTTGAGGPFTNIVTNAPNSGKYQWIVPAVASLNCHLRFIITTANGSDTVVTGKPFYINPCSDIILPWQISGPVTLCAGDSVVYFVAPATGAISYTWTLPSGWTGSSTTNLINVVASSTGGMISVVANSSTSTSMPRVLNIDVVVVDTSVTVNGSTLTAMSATGSFQWMDCDSGKIIPGEVSQSFTATVDGSYAVIVTDSGCVDTSSCYAIVVTGIRKKNKDPFFTISPNPTQGRVTVKSSSGIDKIEIYSVLGELIYKTYGSLHIAEIDISDQPDGVYFLNVVSDDKKQSVKIIKQE